jgi:hypothetical protein
MPPRLRATELGERAFSPYVSGTEAGIIQSGSIFQKSRNYAAKR